MDGREEDDGAAAKRPWLTSRTCWRHQREGTEPRANHQGLQAKILGPACDSVVDTSQARASKTLQHRSRHGVQHLGTFKMLEEGMCCPDTVLDVAMESSRSDLGLTTL